MFSKGTRLKRVWSRHGEGGGSNLHELPTAPSIDNKEMSSGANPRLHPPGQPGMKRKIRMHTMVGISAPRSNLNASTPFVPK